VAWGYILIEVDENHLTCGPGSIIVSLSSAV